MAIRKSVAAAGTVAVLGAAAGLLVPAIASAGSATHTLKFTAKVTDAQKLSKTEFAQSEKDVRHGKIIGYDTFYAKFNPKTNKGHGGVTLDTSGGFLYGTLNLNTKGKTIHGKVTGGTGKFAGTTGTITGTQLNKHGTRTAVVVTYHK